MKKAVGRHFKAPLGMISLLKESCLTGGVRVENMLPTGVYLHTKLVLPGKESASELAGVGGTASTDFISCWMTPEK